MKFKFRRYFLYYLARIAGFIFYLLPQSIGVALASGLGFLAYLILQRYRTDTINNLRLALSSGLETNELNAIARRVFQNLGKNAAELVLLPKFTAANIDKFVKIVGRERLDEALARGKGVIVITGHFGNWELVPVTLRLKGYSGAVAARRIYFDRYDRYLNGLRSHHGVEVIYRDESPRKILKVLKANGIIGMVADQDVDSVDGVFIDFFGRKAYTPSGPAALASASGASLIPAFIVRDNGRHTLIFDKPLKLVDAGDKRKDLVENTQKWSSVIEEYIKRYPDQWVWMHKRWKTKTDPIHDKL